MMQINGTHHSEFKETEIGLIPVDWECVQLEELLVKTKNKDPRKEPDTTFRYIDVSSVSNEINRVAGYSLIMGMDAPSRARKVVASGDTIFATVRPYLRNIAQIPEELHNSICSTGYCVLRPDKNLLDANFLFFQTLTDFFIDSIVSLQRGSSYPAVSDEVVKSRNIHLPPLSEQRRIAAVLNAIQDEIAVQDDILRELREFKRSTMERLFTYGAGDSPADTKMTEIGEIPAHWEVKTIGDVCDLKSGSTPSRSKREYWDEGSIPWVKTGEIDYHVITFSEEHITDIALKETSLRLFPSNTLILAMYGQGITRGKVGILGIEATINQACLAIMPKNNALLTFYLFHYLNHSYLRLRDHSHGTQQANLSGRIVASIEIAIPAKNEQQKIIEILDETDRKISTEEDRKAALQEFFRTMLHQLMTGQIRLLSDDGLEGFLDGKG